MRAGSRRRRARLQPLHGAHPRLPGGRLPSGNSPGERARCRAARGDGAPDAAVRASRGLRAESGGVPRLVRGHQAEASAGKQFSRATRRAAEGGGRARGGDFVGRAASDGRGGAGGAGAARRQHPRQAHQHERAGGGARAAAQDGGGEARHARGDDHAAGGGGQRGPRGDAGVPGSLRAIRQAPAGQAADARAQSRADQPGHGGAGGEAQRACRVRRRLFSLCESDGSADARHGHVRSDCGVLLSAGWGGELGSAGGSQAAAVRRVHERAAAAVHRDARAKEPVRGGARFPRILPHGVCGGSAGRRAGAERGAGGRRGRRPHGARLAGGG
mmetsp:Transcript_20391/g.39059  ORF Transcript_20391/g.39059 Transcript_20391/m.39059 type:complete len:330 (+) Transcript_20391:146-1135(+)